MVVSNLDQAFAGPVPDGVWSYQDAQALSFDDRSFDWVFVSEGLHHCRSPTGHWVRCTGCAGPESWPSRPATAC